MITHVKSMCLRVGIIWSSIRWISLKLIRLKDSKALKSMLTFYKLTMLLLLMSARSKTKNNKEIMPLVTFSSKSLVLRSKLLLHLGPTLEEHLKLTTRVVSQAEMEVSSGILPNLVARVSCILKRINPTMNLWTLKYLGSQRIQCLPFRK